MKDLLVESHLGLLTAVTKLAWLVSDPACPHLPPEVSSYGGRPGNAGGKRQNLARPCSKEGPSSVSMYRDLGRQRPVCKITSLTVGCPVPSKSGTFMKDMEPRDPGNSM
ncbi:Hypothetical predicted protein [Marmota monax]|uniref:Uncharacterized protein n=1 Tax=Marmota monax TaxID=9995 RepID=A0A5E4BRB4_MARMO|nr:hypothetical protein GHT09_012862 [Marmota monax]VTJ71590.1 Hypothetical predicted protein [Marmota monax]VTJ71591.1 Hypothetical predicted protein [Marmota monax]